MIGSLKSKIALMFAVTAILVMMSYMFVFAYESDFSDGTYQYNGTGYTTNDNDSYLSCKIDKYYYENGSDVMFCAVDNYYYKRSSSGTVINSNCYGYGVARFEKGSRNLASSGRCYGYGNSVAFSDGCSNWSYSPHYYGTTVRE